MGISAYRLTIAKPTSNHTYQETPRSAMLDWGVHEPEQFCPSWFIYGSQFIQTLLESQYTLHVYRGFYDLTICWSWFFSFFRSFQNWFLMSCTPSNHIITKQPWMTIVDLFFKGFQVFNPWIPSTAPRMSYGVTFVTHPFRLCTVTSVT